MGAEPMIVGAAIFALGALSGRFVPVRKRHPKPLTAARPVCGCGDNRSYHEDGTGPCHADGTYLGNGRYKGCGCRKYTGPEPLPEYFAPEIGG